MDLGTIIAIIISGCTIAYSIFRDNTKDTDYLKVRVASIETEFAVQRSSIIRLEADQDKMQESLQKLEDQIHDLDIKVEKILTLLQKK